MQPRKTFLNTADAWNVARDTILHALPPAETAFVSMSAGIVVANYHANAEVTLGVGNPLFFFSRSNMNESSLTATCQNTVNESTDPIAESQNDDLYPAGAYRVEITAYGIEVNPARDEGFWVDFRTLCRITMPGRMGEKASLHGKTRRQFFAAKGMLCGKDTTPVELLAAISSFFACHSPLANQSKMIWRV